MIELTVEQLSISTAQEESYYFTGRPEVSVSPRPSVILPPGTYRVVEGRLYRIVSSAPPTIPGVNMRIVAGSD